MPSSRVTFQTGEFYHVFNRGVDKRSVFESLSNYERFILGMKEFNTKNPIGSLQFLKKLRKRQSKGRGPTPNSVGVGPLPNFLVEIIAYCLLPNHYHIIFKQVVDGGISEFMKRLSGGYTGYFNTKNERSGALFQGKFKAVHIKTDSQLLQTSLYVNGNVEIHNIDKADNWQFGSCPDYLGLEGGGLCNKNIILDNCSQKEYKELLKAIIKETQERKHDVKFLDL